MSVENQQHTPAAQASKPPPAGIKPTLADSLAGEVNEFVQNLSPYLPADLIGGSVPHVAGQEEGAVWNAASQACGTEKVHYSYSIHEGRIWYLACPSASMASNPDSWCPLAAALPGNSEFWDKETVYLYEQEGQASALRWDPETGRIQVFLGASRTILPRIQSMNANFVTINPDTADKVQWRNRMLRTEKLSRATVRTLIMTGLFVNMAAALILAVNLVSIGFVQRDLESIKTQTDEAALELVESAANVMQSDTLRHMVRIQHILDNIARSNGYLVLYQVNGNRTEWNAVVPQGLVDIAIRETTLTDTSTGRVRVFKPEKQPGTVEGDNVRITGKR